MLIAIRLFIFSMHIHNMATNIATLALFILFLSLFSLGDRIFTQIVCAKLTKSENQCYVESIRVFVKRSGSSLGAISAYYAFSNIFYFSFIVIITNLIFFIIILLRKRTLANPSPII